MKRERTMGPVYVGGWFLALSASVFAGPLQEPLYRLDAPEGTGPDGYGYEVARAGDLDGDGFPDLLAYASPDLKNYVTATSGRTGQLLYIVGGCDYAPNCPNVSLAGLGDVNGDGHDDFAVGDPSCFDYLGGPGGVDVYSGKDGSLLYFIEGEEDCDDFGVSVSSLEHDIDGDGIFDFVVGASPSFSSTAGYFQARSGSDGHVIYEVDPPGGSVGAILTTVGRVDGDDVPDFLAGGDGYVQMVSGQDGTILFTVFGYGTYGTGMGDLNDDGIADFALASVFYGQAAGRVTVFHSPDLDTTGTPSISFAVTGETGDSLAGIFGRGLDSGADLDGDGYFDLVVGVASSDDAGIEAGKLLVYTGRTGAPLPGYPILGDSAGDSFGTSVAVLGDVNGDGVAEVAAGALRDLVAGDQDGSVLVVSGGAKKPLPLDVGELFTSLETGTAQQFDIDAGPGNAGNTYWLLGSVSGFHPGLSLPGAGTLPLNFDDYTRFTIANPNTPPLFGSLGLLDSGGEGAASFSTGAGASVNLAGVMVDHAYVVLDGNGGLTAVSNPVVATLEESLDCNQNGTADGVDIASGASADANADGVPDDCQDCNGNGIPDSLDLMSGVAPDLDGNGVLDECDTDCNGNGTPDSLDLLDQTSQDVDGNGVPDECQVDCNVNGIPDGFELTLGGTDCNANGILDACDIASGLSQDCNLNGLPDGCEGVVCTDCNLNQVADEFDIALGTSIDLNGDGIPDECQLPLFSENFEAGVSGWSFGEFLAMAWHVAEDGECGSATKTAAFNRGPAQCDYDLSPLVPTGVLASPPVTFDLAPPYEVRVTSRLASDPLGTVAASIVLVSEDGTTLQPVAPSTAFDDSGVPETLAFPVDNSEEWLGKTARLQFIFSASAGPYLGDGWLIDDVAIFAVP